MTLSKSWGTNMNPPTTRDIYTTQLQNHILVDIGYVTQVIGNGEKAIVQLYDEGKTKLKAEVLSIGYDGNTFDCIHCGQYVLVFIPRTALTVQDGKLHLDASPFDFRYAKCMPIGLAGGNTVKLGVNLDTVSIASYENYSLNFAEKLINLFSENLSIYIDTSDGSMNIGLKNTSIKLSDDGAEVVTNCSYNQQTGEMTDYGAKVSIAKDGSIDIDSKKAINIKAADGFTLDGDVTVTGALDVADGNFTVDK